MKMPEITEVDAYTNNPEYRECFAMFCAGWSVIEISKMATVDHGRLQRWSFNYDWPGQRKAVQQAYAKKNPPEKSPLLKAIANSRKDEIKKKFQENMGEMALEDSEHWADMKPELRLAAAQSITSLAGTHRKTLELDKDAERKEHGHINLTFLTSSNDPGMVRMLEPESVKEIPEKVIDVESEG